MARLKRLQCKGLQHPCLLLQWTAFSGDSKKQIPSGDDNKKGKGYY
jgi:hypothetical protein